MFLSGERDNYSKGKTDNDGRIELQNLPTGKVRLSVQSIGGFTPVVTEAAVKSNTTMDLGEIQIASDNSGFFWLEGTIAYDGGGSVGRVQLSRRVGALRIYLESSEAGPWDGSSVGLSLSC